MTGRTVADSAQPTMKDFTSAEGGGTSRCAGASPIDLVDGDELGDLLKRHALDVDVATRTIEEVAVQSELFETL